MVATPGNSLNISSAGLVKFDGTATFSAVTVTQFDVLIGAASNGITSVGPGSAGQVLQSGGNSANPAYSTATYPSTATGTGTILRADGTNWAATTTTYPNTNAINTLLYASASNVMSALATSNDGVLITSHAGVPSWLAAGTTGQVLTATTGAPATWQPPASATISITGDSGGALTASSFTFTGGTTGLTFAGATSTETLGGTLVVSNGGSGVSSHTAYSLLAGGTTSTAAVQSVASVGSAGQILTSNGSSALPTWQTAPSGTFSPNSVLNIVEDFIGGTGIIPGSNFAACNYMWSITSSSSAVSWNSAGAGAVIGHPGIWYHGAINTSNTFVCLALPSANNSFILGGGTIVINWVFNIATLSNSTNRYTLNIGMGDTYASKVADQANGVYFKYVDNVNSGKWQTVTTAASSPTTTSSNVVVTTGWHNAQITIDSTAATVTFLMDGASLGSVSTTIPTLAISPLLYIEWLVGTVAAGTIGADLMYLTQTLTTPR